jgi:hypothetical protein
MGTFPPTCAYTTSPQAFTKMRRPISAILPHPMPAASTETSLESRVSLSAIALVVTRLLVVVASRIEVRIALAVVLMMTNTVGAAQTLLPVLAILTVAVVLPGDVAN